MFGDIRHAIFAVEHDESVTQLVRVIGKTIDLKRVRREEPVAGRRLAAGNFVTEHKRQNVAAEQAQHALQRAHPAHVAIAPAHGFRPRQIANGFFQQPRQNIPGLGTGLFDHGKQERALWEFAFLALSARQPVGFQKPFNGFFRRIDLGAAFFFAQAWLFFGQVLDHQRQAARRDIGAGITVFEPGIFQTGRHETFQVGSGTCLHAGRNFFREKFEQKFSHDYSAASA